MTYFWVNFRVKKTKKSLYSGFFGVEKGVRPLKINPIFFFGKYKICTIFWYKVYPNRIKSKETMHFFLFFFYFFLVKIGFYHRKHLLKRNKNNHWHLIFNTIWINFVSKYCANLIFLKKKIPKKFGLIQRGLTPISPQKSQN